MARPHIAARLEDGVRRRIDSQLRRRGWHERLLGYTGYGTSEKVRVFARVTLSRLEPEETRTALTHAQDSLLDIAQRGFRHFLSAPAVGVPVRVCAGQAEHVATTDRGGYVDVEVTGHGLEPGWQEVQVGLANGDTLTVSVFVVADDTPLGLVSDIDDTVMVTHLPRILIAGWNTFVRSEQVREPVAGMGAMYRALVAEHPGMPVLFLSTGAWNTAPALTRFLRRHDYPVGPLLLTDWGPTNTGWFRSGQEHKERELRRLRETFPDVRWILVGDDGQHDPVIYGQFAEEFPEAVEAICIRELTPAEQLLSSGLPVATDELLGKRVEVPMLKAPNGFGLHQLLVGAQARRAEAEGPVPPDPAHARVPRQEGLGDLIPGGDEEGEQDA
ncbi:App1 family protein [Ornithinimicrobium flavum]|uniref:App1 family protein n=1 Tax=Ornithinimicrobium flavum TaxID=1288636 RepID=UPI00106F3C10|nr:phosphatase domain-containing protein [Ornithinimicrobium flavum]